MSIFTGRARVPEQPAMSGTPGAKALRIAIDASAEAEAWKRKAEEAEARCLGGVTRADVALEAYRLNRHVPQRELVDALLEIRSRLWTEAS